jgi:Methyltransferase domain
VQYLDRWEPEENAELFPELENASYPRPDIVADLNRDALQVVASETLDFVVASHVIEHLVNPLRILSDIYRTLKPGGLLLILLPDRRRTFDRGRDPTPLEHIISDFDVGMVEVSDEHLLEFMSHDRFNHETVAAVQGNSARRQAIFELQRQRSIHVHCWTLLEFVPLISFSIERFSSQWQLVDGLITEEQGAEGIEFGLLLQKAVSDVLPSEAAMVFRDSFHQWFSARQLELTFRKMAAQHPQLVADLDATRISLRSTREELCRSEQTVEALLQTRTFRYTRPLRELYGRIRSQVGPQHR